MKTDEISFTTNESVDWIADTLRMLANNLNANVDPIQQDSFGGYGTAPGAIEVVMWGHVGFIGGLKHFRVGSANNDWGVQVYVFDRGSHREIQLIALGESAWTMSSIGVLNLGASKEKRDKIAQALRPTTTPSTSPLPQNSQQPSTGMGQPGGYTQLSSSGQSSSQHQTSSSNSAANANQNLDPAAAQNFASLQEMIRNYENKNN